MIKFAHPENISSAREFMNWHYSVDVIRRELASGLLSSSIVRLLMAAILGGLIGLEREWKHRAAGLRTNMFICFGAAMFTLLSEGLAGVPSDVPESPLRLFLGSVSLERARLFTTAA